MTALLLHGVLADPSPDGPSASRVRLHAAGLIALCTQLPSSLRDAPDPDAAIALALAYDTLLSEQMHLSDVLPVRFGAVFKDGRAVCAELVNGEARYRAAMSRIAVAREYRLRISVNAGPPVPLEAAADGRAFLRQRSAMRSHRDGASRSAEKFIAGMRTRVATIVRAVGPGKASAGRLAEIPLLVSVGRTAELASLISALQGEAESHGVVLDLRGPYPAYSFCLPEEANA